MTPPDSNIPHGFCHCGCGQKTDLIPYSAKGIGWIKGEPKRFINGHNSRLLTKAREEISYGNIDGEPVAFIPLTQGQRAIVDAAKLGTILFLSKNWYFRKGYAFCTVAGATIRMHQVLLRTSDGMEPDHRNRNGLDNRISNLRDATRLQNCANSRKRTSTGFRGVTVIPGGKYRSRFKGAGVSKSLGCFDTAQEAALAWDIEAVKAYGEFAMLNFPEAWFRSGI